jgi:hypothetical protein
MKSQIAMFKSQATEQSQKSKSNSRLALWDLSLYLIAGIWALGFCGGREFSSSKSLTVFD